MTHLIGTLDLAIDVLAASSAWIAAVGSGNGTAEQHILTGLSGYLYEGSMATDAGSAPLALPLADLSIAPDFATETDGHKRWERAGSIFLDVAVAGAANNVGYRASLQLADDLIAAFQVGSDAGTFTCDLVTMPGPPMRHRPDAPAVLRSAWSFRLHLHWSQQRKI